MAESNNNQHLHHHILYDGAIGINPDYGKIFEPTDEQCVKLLYFKKRVDNGYSHDSVVSLDVYIQTPVSIMEGVESSAKKYIFCNSKRKNRSTRRVSVDERSIWRSKKRTSPVMNKDGITMGHKIMLYYFENNQKTNFVMQEYWLDADETEDTFTFNVMYKVKQADLNNNPSSSSVALEGQMINNAEVQLNAEGHELNADEAESLEGLLIGWKQDDVPSLDDIFSSNNTTQDDHQDTSYVFDKESSEPAVQNHDYYSCEKVCDGSTVGISEGDGAGTSTCHDPNSINIPIEDQYIISGVANDNENAHDEGGGNGSATSTIGSKRKFEFGESSIQ